MDTEYRFLNDWFLINHETRPKGANSLLHYHHSYEIFVIISGETSMLIDDKVIDVHKNDIVLLKPDSIHKNLGENMHDRYSVHFSMKYLLAHFSQSVADDLLCVFDTSKLTLTADALRETVRLLQRMERNDKYAYACLAQIIAVLNDKNSVYKCPNAQNSRTVDSILECISRSYDTITCLDDIARQLHISKQYLCSVFKKETALTVSDYINSVRVQNACDILRNSSANITETAFRCGYGSTAYFCRVFKQITGITPTEYRQRPI